MGKAVAAARQAAKPPMAVVKTKAIF